MRAWTVVLVCLTLAAPALSQTKYGGPAQGRVLWLRPGSGAQSGPSGLVTQWVDAGGSGMVLSQGRGAQRPRFERIGPGGRAALHFDGNDLLSAAAGMPTGSYTKVAVVALESYASNNNVLSGAAQHALFFGFSDRAQLFHSGTFVTSSVPTPLGRWVILVATYDSAMGKGVLYQDGVQVGTGNAAPHSDPALQVGAFAGGNNFQGHIGEVMVYDHVLSASERQALDRYLAGRFLDLEAPSVSFERLPRDGQVLARDRSTGQGTLEVSGTVHTKGYFAIELRVLRSGQPFLSRSQLLLYIANSARFDFTVPILAELADYEAQVDLLKPGRRLPILRRQNIVAGDLLLVNGQSNAVASDYWSEGLGNLSQSHWIRSFGTDAPSNEVSLDLHWDMADALQTHEHASVGTWALRMAEQIVGVEGVPIGILNGAIGGTAIAQHLRNDANPTDLGTIYGRLLYRAQQSDVARHARAMLWYQGESDFENGSAWRTRFLQVHADWQEDYPALEQIYLFQVRKGCGVSDIGVREVQRTLPDVVPDLQAMSTTAAPSHDGCHYLYAGYRELGERIARLVLRDLYGSTDTQEIDAPNIERAEWVDAAHDRIRLVFEDPDDGLVFEPGAEANVSLDDGTSVLAGQVIGNTIVLTLAGPSSATIIRYDGHAQDGPWIKNARGVGALTFFGVPIQ
ncbi:MAG: sialate O-acetylesterase [Planctomycetota bacterium]